MSYHRESGIVSFVASGGQSSQITYIDFVAGQPATKVVETNYDPQFVAIYHVVRVADRYTWQWNGVDGWTAAIGQSEMTTQPFPGYPYYESTVVYPHSQPTQPLFPTATSLPSEKVSATIWEGPFPGTSQKYYDSSSTKAVATFGNPNGKTWVKVNPTLQPLVLGSDMNLYNSGGPLPAGQITVNAKGVNCDQEHVIEVDANGLTPVVVESNSGVTSFSFGIEPRLPKKVALTRAYHPSFIFPPELGALQSNFDQASRDRLATDSDGCGMGGGGDDVETYIEFDVQDAASVTFPPEFSQSYYYNVPNFGVMNHLISEGNFAFVKQVSLLPFSEEDDTATLGATYGGNRSIVLSNFATSLVVVHEWLHTAGLGHRGSPSNPDAAGSTTTESSMPDLEAVMSKGSTGSGVEINSLERYEALNW